LKNNATQDSNTIRTNKTIIQADNAYPWNLPSTAYKQTPTDEQPHQALKTYKGKFDTQNKLSFYMAMHFQDTEKPYPRNNDH
jgi:LmbE family N-acetylglucosaminyl deacetylase